MSVISSSMNVSVISPQEAYQNMKSSDKHILLDVRTLSEYKDTRIDGAKLIPANELSSRAPMELPDKHIPIYVYCRSGARAAKAAKLLVNRGYTNVFNLGGIVNWPYGTVKEI